MLSELEFAVSALERARRKLLRGSWLCDARIMNQAIVELKELQERLDTYYNYNKHYNDEFF